MMSASHVRRQGIGNETAQKSVVEEEEAEEDPALEIERWIPSEARADASCAKVRVTKPPIAEIDQKVTEEAEAETEEMPIEEVEIEETTDIEAVEDLDQDPTTPEEREDLAVVAVTMVGIEEEEMTDTDVTADRTQETVEVIEVETVVEMEVEMEVETDIEMVVETVAEMSDEEDHTPQTQETALIAATEREASEADPDVNLQNP